MRVLVMKISLRVNWCHSLKEKRMVAQSIIQKLKNKFNVSVGEVDHQDLHNSIVIGIAAVCGSCKQCDSTMEHILTFIEENCDGEIIHIENQDTIF